MTAPILWKSTPIAPCELECEVSRGPTATVHLARRGERRVALKAFDPSQAQPGIEAALRLAGPWVAGICDVGLFGDRLAVVSEWVDGVPLSRLVAGAARHGRLPQEAALHLGFQVCRALTAAHELADGALVHGALDLSHVLCGRDGAVKVCGFGGPVSRAGRLRAHRGFAAPEVLGGDGADVLSDVWAAGALVYFLLTGSTPSEAALGGDGAVPVPSALNPGLDDGLDTPLLAALCEDPCDRAHSARLLSAAIDRYAESLELELDPSALAALVTSACAS
jgi:serine/threonine protein kinase